MGIAATGVPALVMSKGHKIEEIPEVPLIVDDKIESIQKTKEAVNILRGLKAWTDVEKVYKSKRMRAGKGKMRNRRRVMRSGPCIVYDKDNGVRKAFRNIPGVTLLNVEKLNLRVLAPGGHVGRFCIWSRSALAKLDGLYGTWTQPSAAKSNFNLPQPMMTNTDLTKWLQSQEIQAAIRPKKQGSTKSTVKRNPLKNASEMIKLNPFAVVQKRLTLNNEEANAKAKDEAKSDKRKAEGGEGGNRKRMRRPALLELEKKRQLSGDRPSRKKLQRPRRKRLQFPRRKNLQHLPNLPRRLKTRKGLPVQSQELIPKML